MLRKFLPCLILSFGLFLVSCDLGTGSSGDETADPASETVKETAPDGSGENPFPVKTADDLYAIGRPNEVDGHSGWENYCCYRLEADIDLSAGGYTEWAPIPYFSGTFDGNGHTISRMVITTSNSDHTGYGLFASLWGATVKNLTVSGTITLASTSDTFIGGLAGKTWGSVSEESEAGCTIINCHSSVAIDTYGDLVGGLIGACENNSTVSSCSATGKVIAGPTLVGGVTSGGRVGGLIGSAENVTVEKSYATGQVQLRIHTSFAGGLAGYSSNSSFTDCYAQGDVSSASRPSFELGGFLGKASGTLTITHCYASGAVSGGYLTADDEDGFIAEGSATVSGCYAKRSSSVSGVTQLSDSALKQQTSFSGWDFDSLWTIDEGSSYPYFQ